MFNVPLSAVCPLGCFSDIKVLKAEGKSECAAFTNFHNSYTTYLKLKAKAHIDYLNKPLTKNTLSPISYYKHLFLFLVNKDHKFIRCMLGIIYIISIAIWEISDHLKKY